MKTFIATLLVTFSLVANAAECDHLYPNQKKVAVKETVQLCNSWYVSLYNEKQRKVVLVSEVLDPKTATSARNSKFRSDQRVKNPVRDSEYDRTGYDRGHMVPADDSSNQKEMDETFLLTNAVPQDPNLNRGQWKKLEGYVRSKARGQTIYVVTGAIYDDKKRDGNISVPVPTAMYKVAYFNSGVEYWYAKNERGAKAIRTTKSQLFSETGINLP